MVAVDLGAARIAVRLADLDELGAHHLREPLGTAENVGEVGDAREELAVLGDDLVLLERREAVQAHVEDRLRLGFGEPVAACMRRRTRR